MEIANGKLLDGNCVVVWQYGQDDDDVLPQIPVYVGS